MTKAAVASYFDFVKDWLAERPRRTARKKTVGGVEPPRFVSPELAVFTRRRIRSGRLDWQPPRWFARHKRNEAVHRVHPADHPKGIQGLIGKEHRLILVHTHGDRLRLRATLKFLEARTDDTFLSTRCYGSRPKGRRKCTDRGAALRAFHRLVWKDGHCWVAKLDVKKFFDQLPHGPVLAALAAAVPDRGCCREIEGYMAWYWRESWPGHDLPPPQPLGLPQGSPVSGVLANIFMTSFDNALTAAGAEHIRYIDDITVVAKTPEQLAEHLGLAMQLISGLGLQLSPGKTQVAYLGPGMPPQDTLLVPGCPAPLTVHREFDLLGAQSIAEMLPVNWGNGWEGVWLGVTIEGPEQAWRADVLRRVPAAVRFISYEPAIGPLAGTVDLTGIHWLVAGGESGTSRRPDDINWYRDIRDQCNASGTSFFFKQRAALHPGREAHIDGVQHYAWPEVAGRSNA